MTRLAALLGLAGVLVATTAADAQAPLRWYKGNTHTHTINSDGDSSPDDVVKWYRTHGYQFLVLTDHNVLTEVVALNALHGLDERFLVIRGEEVTDRFGDASIHINALDPSRLVQPQGGTSVVDVIQRNVDEIRAAKGIPHINHPNFRWSITADELKQVKNNKLFEIFNGHPQVNNIGGGTVAGLEEVWDAILSSGLLLYGLAVDDAHHFNRPGDPTAAGPGRGWVHVRAASLTPAAILDAMERGEFYSSTGVELADYRVDGSSVTVEVKASAWSKYRIQFIGREGRVLAEVRESKATYAFKGDEGYVRARIIESNGLMAWTQPVMLAPTNR
jgi:hypothetical protein